MSEQKPTVKVDVLPISIDGKEAFKLVDKVLHKPFKNLLEEAGGTLAEIFHDYRNMNRVKSFIKFQKLLSKNNVPRHVLAKGWLIQAFEAMGDAEEDDLQNLWANLLNNATLSAENQQPQYVHTLKLMSTSDAKRLVEIARRSTVYRDGLGKDIDFKTDKSLGRLAALNLIHGLSIEAYRTNESTNPPTVLSGPGFLTPYGVQFLDAVS